MAPAANTNVELTPQELEVAGEELRTRFFAELEENKDENEEFCEEDLQRLRNDSWYCQRFVLHEKGDMDKAVVMVKEAFKWRKEFNVHDIKESNLLAEFFEAQGVYPYNSDVHGNPVLMLVVKLHRKDADIQPELRRFLIYWIEKLEREFNDKKMTVLFDCSGAGLSNLDLDMIRFLVTTFRNYYPHLLACIVVYDMPWLFNAAWKIIKSWLPQDAVEKIKFVNKKTIFEYVDKENLPVAMGGFCNYDGSKEIEDYRILLQKQLDLVVYGHAPKKEKKLPSNTSKMKSNLELNPPEFLTFPTGSEFQKSKTTLILKNVSDHYLGYKIRGNNIEAYKVKPFTGFLEPNDIQIVTVELVDGQPCLEKHKFLVQAVPVDNKNINVRSFNALWKAAPKALKEEHMLFSKSAKNEAQKKATLKEDIPAPPLLNPIFKKTTEKILELEKALVAIRRSHTIVRWTLLIIMLFLCGTLWLLSEVVDLLRLQPGGLCDRTIRDSLLATLICRPDRTILPSHMM